MRQGPIRGDEHPWRDFAAALGLSALVGRKFLNPPPWPGWPTRFRLWRRR